MMRKQHSIFIRWVVCVELRLTVPSFNAFLLYNSQSICILISRSSLTFLADVSKSIIYETYTWIPTVGHLTPCQCMVRSQVGPSR